MKSGINHGDPITGSHAAGVLLAALRYRRRTGKGMMIDVSQHESAVALTGADVLAYQISGEEPERKGNRSPDLAPHNVYPCAGEDRWVTIAVTSSEQWRGLARLVGGEDLAGDPRFATAAGRLQHLDELDEIITRWTAGQDAFWAAEELQGIGVPSAAVLRGPDLLEDPHYTERGTFVTVDHPQVGPRRYPGMPWKMSATPVRVRWASPTLGQHNNQIYGELLGMPREEIAALEAQEVIGTKPIGSRLMG